MTPPPRPGLPDRRDRHGRAARVDGTRERRPPQGFRTRDARRFRRLAEDALRALPAPAAEKLRGASVAIVEVPRDLPASADARWGGDADPVANADVPLATFDPGPPRARLVLHRRVIESRATRREDLIDLIVDAVTEAVASAYGWADDPDDDPGGGW